MESLYGVVERITFMNEENGFCVLKVKVPEETDLVTVVGTLYQVMVGVALEMDGIWKVDKRFGRQFVVERYHEALPATITGIQKYLGSGLIKGIGPAFAKKIVSKFKEDTLRIIEHHPEKLSEVEGLGEKKIAFITKAWQEQKEIKNVMIFLQGQGVSTKFAIKIYKTYGDNSLEILKNNPYRLADDIWGVGFKTADAIAKKMGIREDSLDRIYAGVLFALGNGVSEGHCYMQKDDLKRLSESVLGLSLGDCSQIWLQMVAKKMIFCEQDKVYTLPLIQSEMAVAQKIVELTKQENTLKKEEFSPLLEKIQKENSIQYDPIQKKSIQTALESTFMVLTGGPGTGKTTTITGIIRVFKAMEARVSLAAPTGRAAKRMTETTGVESKTIHRLLEYSPQEGYKKNEENPLTCDLLIIDESSMIDIILMHHLLKAVPAQTRVILVGDVDQLPSVGAGNVLKDIITSGKIPVVALKKIYRQALGSQIVQNAHRVNRGEMPELCNEKEGDFFFIAQEDEEKIVQTIKDLCATRLPKRYGFHPIEDIQVLCPMQRGELGARRLNEVLQSALNPSEEWIKVGGVCYKLGDKVMQIKNNYDKQVFNGDIGRIIEIDHDDKMVMIAFEDQMILYDGTELDEIVLAYATTVHKSQGSEYSVVIVPLTHQHYVMLQRNLLYTSMTRAKKFMVLVGTQKAIQFAVRNERISQRNTSLSKRITEASSE